MDFVADQFFDGRRFRALTVVDTYCRKCLAIQLGQSIKGMDVVEVMEKIKQEIVAVPERFQIDTDSDLISEARTYEDMTTR
jgi:putative transposase